MRGEDTARILRPMPSSFISRRHVVLAAAGVYEDMLHAIENHLAAFGLHDSPGDIAVALEFAGSPSHRRAARTPRGRSRRIRGMMLRRSVT